VTPQEKDLRVRVIRISAANPYCEGDLVRAADRVLPETTMRKIAGKIDICSYIDESVTAALKAAAPKGVESIEDSATLSIVAKCGAQETRLLPELVSGKFDSAFCDYTCAGKKCDTNYLAWLLRGYTGPPVSRDPSSVERVNASSLRLSKYDLPKYSPLAKQARIFGEVRLTLAPDTQTGRVKDVQLVSGNPMLGNPAVDAVRQWQFSPGTQLGQPVAAVLRFSLCPDE